MNLNKKKSVNLRTQHQKSICKHTWSFTIYSKKGWKHCEFIAPGHRSVMTSYAKQSTKSSPSGHFVHIAWKHDVNKMAVTCHIWMNSCIKYVKNIIARKRRWINRPSSIGGTYVSPSWYDKVGNRKYPRRTRIVF